MRSEMPSPAASSAAVAMRRPEERRAKLPCRRPVTDCRFRCALREAMLVLTRRPMSELLGEGIGSGVSLEPGSDRSAGLAWVLGAPRVGMSARRGIPVLRHAPRAVQKTLPG